MAASDVLKPYVPTLLPQRVITPESPMKPSGLGVVDAALRNATGLDPALQRWLSDNHNALAQAIKLLVEQVKKHDGRLVAGGL